MGHSRSWTPICAWLPRERQFRRFGPTIIIGATWAESRVSNGLSKICTKIFSDWLSESASHVYPWINISFIGPQMIAVSAIEPWQGKVVEGKYPLLELIGTGPRGPVFRTELSTPDGRKSAAIKVIPVEGKHLQAELSRLVLSRALSHPNLIKILDAGQCEIRRQPAIYVVTEFAEENLGQILPSRALAAGEVEQMLPPLIDALSYLHRNGFVHGRVQPSNVMAVADTLKLSSDSVRKIEDAVASNQAQNDSPGANDPASASDVRALGALLVAALAPETRGQPSEQQLTLIPSSVPEPFRRIARECLRPNPGDRCTLEQIRQMPSSPQASADRVLTPVISK